MCWILLDETQSSTAIDVPQTDAEDEECSFLRIENVVSLAADSETNKTAVENSIVSGLFNQNIVGI